MADIRINLKSELVNGQSVVFKAPCDCTEVTGLVAYYHNGEKVVNTSFSFKDAHGNNVAGLGNLFGQGAYVKVILDTNTKSAYIQNADTNSYLEENMLHKTDVVDNLESTRTDLPLSANQGRELNSKLEDCGTILWENPNKGTAFAPQSIDLSSKDWKVAEILFWSLYDNAIETCRIYRDENCSHMINKAILISRGTWQMTFSGRTVTVTDNIITFSGGRITDMGTYTHTDDNNYMKPIKIFKIV